MGEVGCDTPAALATCVVPHAHAMSTYLDPARCGGGGGRGGGEG